MNFSIISGSIYSDLRGNINHVNEFDMTKVKRFYLVENSINMPKRAWQAHQFETKWFYVTNGRFKIGLVKPDNWHNPSNDLKVEYIILNENDSKILQIPPGYANGIISLEPNSKLMVYSDFTIEEAATDNIKFDINTWQL